MPYGGVKDSGNTREGPAYAVRELTEDRLVVLEHGRIIEHGTHDALLRANGHYASLWRRQSGGFIDAGEVQAAE